MSRGPIDISTARAILRPDQITDDLGPRTFERSGDGYRFILDYVGIDITIDRLRRERQHELIGELTVRCDLAGARTIDGILSAADFSLSSAPARQERARLLAT